MVIVYILKDSIIGELYNNSIIKIKFNSDSRFWRMMRSGAVSDVLGALEYPECQAGQEIASCHQTGCRTQSKSRSSWRKKFFFVCVLWIVDKLKKNVAKYVQSTKTRFKRSLILQIKVRKKKQTFFKNFLKENFAENIWWMNDCLEQVDKFRYLLKHFISIFFSF